MLDRGHIHPYIYGKYLIYDLKGYIKKEERKKERKIK